MTRASSFPADYTIRQLQKNDKAIYQIYLLKLNSSFTAYLYHYLLLLGFVIVVFEFFDGRELLEKVPIFQGISLYQSFWIAVLLSHLLIFIVSLRGNFLHITNNLARQDGSIVLVIEHNNRLVGYAIQSKKASYSWLDELYVKPNYRRLGLGSYLVQNLARRGVKPIYVFPTIVSFRFYIRNGFTLVQEQNLPSELRKISRRSKLLVLI
ncbi:MULTISPECIES: GNAT family N-acetyltransferase [Nostoc]|uniref:GNAT family N-acetyltransferase n=2 Tax=Nostoc TaxID=1177 RepID=A0ABR8IJT6_9NOSO|nr:MULTISPECIES: GNAT family N-acetyltransferase [Nostoc]MBD2564276.1 GNAT family N-acetyltransferase [Nostoc linckia FACHB-391]MBD2650560.1 GNAT family N-acetyltransferase [Nostoc foliaceum FACHB-393]